jgi:hypothetical protein
MGAANTYCMGRKEDELVLEQTLASFVCGAPPYSVDPLQKKPYWQLELEKDPLIEPIIKSLAIEEVDSEQAMSEDIDLHIAALLTAYSSEVRDSHGLLTAADSYYFALLEYQRRHDSVGIQAEAVREMLDNSPSEASSWRTRLAQKRAEAVEAFSNRAQHYAVGRRTSQGLLHITSGQCAETTLRGYEALFDKEYDLAAQDIEATLSALSAEPEIDRMDHARVLLDQLQRSAMFWTSQIEEAFEVWQAASVRLNQSQVRRNGAWAELLPAVRKLLIDLNASPRPRLNRTFDDVISSSVGRAASRTQCCIRLLELDLHQYAHGLSSSPRVQLLSDLLSSAREDAGLPEVARALLLDEGFRSLESVHIGDSRHGVLDVQSVADHPWTSVLAELFGELIYAVAEALIEDEAACKSATDQFLLQPGLAEIRAVAAVYATPRSGRTALHQATRARSTWFCELLLEHKADPLACEPDGSSPLSIAENDSQCPSALLEALQQAVPNRQQRDTSTSAEEVGQVCHEAEEKFRGDADATAQ